MKGGQNTNAKRSSCNSIHTLSLPWLGSNVGEKRFFQEGELIGVRRETMEWMGTVNAVVVVFVVAKRSMDGHVLSQNLLIHVLL